MDHTYSIGLKKEYNSILHFWKFSKIGITELLLCSLTVITLIVYLQFHWKRRRLYSMAAKIKGPICLPFIGNALLFAGSTISK